MTICDPVGRDALISRVWYALVAILLAAMAIIRPAAADPNQGPGGPILVITSDAPSAKFGRYYAEILRTEGFNAFAVADVSTVNESMLANYDVAILAKMTLTPGQVTLLSELGDRRRQPDRDGSRPRAIGSARHSVPSAARCRGLPARRQPDATRQWHRRRNDAVPRHGDPAFAVRRDTSREVVFQLHATIPPPIRRSRCAALACSAARRRRSLTTSPPRSSTRVRATRPGSAKSAMASRRSGRTTCSTVPRPAIQPNWIDLAKVHVPQADEQQRFLANLITHMTLDRKPLPRFWYLPHAHRAAVLLTGDEHGGAGWTERFDQLQALSAPGCSLADWKCPARDSLHLHESPVSNARRRTTQSTVSRSRFTSPQISMPELR
jgi:hypothetical protein